MLCAIVILLLGLLYGSDAVFALFKQKPFRMWHEGYLVTDSAWVGFIISIVLVALSGYIFMGSRTSEEPKHSDEPPTI